MENTLSMLGYQDEIIPAALLEDFVLEPLVQASAKLASALFMLWSAVSKLLGLLNSGEIKAIMSRIISSIPI